MIFVGGIVTFGVCVFAYLRGGEAERGVSVAAVLILLGSLAGQAMLGRANVWPVVGADLALGVTVGVLAAIHLRPWLYVECALATALLITHFVMIENAGAVVTPLYAATIDGLDFAMLGTLVFATLRQRRAPSTAEAPVEA